MAHYFTKETDDYINKFNAATVSEEKHRLFDVGIKPAFEKLIENLIFVYSYYTIDDVDTLKRECLTVLYEMLPKYDPTKGAKGFSYFNVVAKNWFIFKLRERSKRNRLESELYLDLDHEVARNDPSFTISPHEDKLEEKERWTTLYDAMEMWKKELKKKTEIQVLEAVTFLLRNPDLVSIYNKKAVYLYLRELTGLSTKQVVTNLKRIKDLYSEWSNSFNTDGGLFFGEDERAAD